MPDQNPQNVTRMGYMQTYRVIFIGASSVSKHFILFFFHIYLLGFDKEAGKVWIYPTNFPERTYQLTIAKHALFENTLVTLPTGLGKTFIAAVVMYNFYR